ILCTSTSLTSASLFMVLQGGSRSPSAMPAKCGPAARFCIERIPKTCAFGDQVAIELGELDPPCRAHGNLRGPPENGFAGVDAGCDFAAISAVTTRSPSFNPSTTSVTTPSLIPILICTGFG